MDGPFTEAKELVAGFWMWQVKSLEEAIEWVKRMPEPDDGEERRSKFDRFRGEDFGDAGRRSSGNRKSGCARSRRAKVGAMRPRPG